MSSLRRILASRANGALSRGPVSPEGLARSSQNAVKHGLASSSLVLSNESDSEFQTLHESYLLLFNPQNDLEAGLVEQLVAARWRMERVWALETALLDLEMEEQREKIENKYESIDEIARTALAFRALSDESRSLALLNRYETRYRLAGDRILEKLEKLQGRARQENQTVPNEPNPNIEHP